MLGRLGRIAVVGDEVRVRGALLRVLAVEGRRIERVALSFRPEPEGGAPVEAQVSDAPARRMCARAQPPGGGAPGLASAGPARP